MSNNQGKMQGGSDTPVLKDRSAFRKLSRRNVLTALGATGVMMAAQSFGGASLLIESEASGSPPFVKYVSDLAELRALNGMQEGQAVAVMKTGRAGLFYFSSGNLSAKVAGDPQYGVYIAPNSDTSGASGAWIRQYGQAAAFNAKVNIAWFGAAGDGVTDDYPAIQGAVDFSLNVFFPEAPVQWRVSQSVVVRPLQQLEGECKWQDWNLSADTAKGVKGDPGVAPFTTLPAGTSYPSVPPASAQQRRGLTFYRMHVIGDHAPAVIHHYASNFTYRECCLRSSHAPTLPMRYSYRGTFDNNLIGASNYAGWVVQLYDNCNAIDFKGSNYVAGSSIGGAIDISKSQSITIQGGVHEVVGLPCYRIGGLSAQEAGHIQEVGNCHGIRIVGNYFERCALPISVGMAAYVFGVEIEGNFLSCYGNETAYIAGIELGSVNGWNVRNNSLIKGANNIPTVRFGYNPQATYRYAVAGTLKDNHVQRNDLSNGIDYEVAAGMNAGLLGYLFGSNYMDFTNTKDLTDGSPVTFKTYGRLQEWTSRVIDGTETTKIIDFDFVGPEGGMLEEVTVFLVDGAPDASMSVGYTGNSQYNANTAISSLTFIGERASVPISNQLILGGARRLVIRHTAGTASGRYMVQIRYRK
ncbi:hypothetical protein [Paenibacillus oceani]|uniref:Uncharacterized protein n=1 Tax=Paenibacillus oceani TaxID=2772510 RepID=A0A927CFD7_9BACL|nr:hypothetical protein [Paenibacillus oceani]MBD2864956.1 hypothetical protein [Paenibacillus oceani]